jgi:hypothetical protein
VNTLYVSRISHFKELSDIAFGFLAFVASEAAADRCFSIQARVEGNDR